MLVGSELVLFLLGFVLATSADPEGRCSLTLTIRSQMNKEKQWTGKVGLEHSKVSGPWEVKTDFCEEGDTVRVYATISATSTGLKTVPKGYTHFPGFGYYKFHPDGKTWQMARLACEDEGAHLAVINSEGEADVMTQLFARYPAPLINAGGNTEWAWIGVHELGVNGEYYTVLGEPLNGTGFERWVEGQPNDKKAFSGLLTYRLTGGLGDSTTGWNSTFICEL